MQLQRRVCAREVPGLRGGRKTPCVGSATETGHLSVRDPFFEADEMMQDWVSPARSDTIQMSRTGFERRLSTNTQARKPTKPIVLHLSIGRHTSRPAEVKVGSEHA